MSNGKELIKSSKVVFDIRNAKTAGKKSAATKQCNKYVAQQETLFGKKPINTMRAIKAVLARK